MSEEDGQAHQGQLLLVGRLSLHPLATAQATRTLRPYVRASGYFVGGKLGAVPHKGYGSAVPTANRCRAGHTNLSAIN